MLSMLLIDEPDVVLLLNNGRFEEPVEGYIMMDGPQYLGHALFRVADGVTTVLEGGVNNSQHLDGIVRACIANGENRGAAHFAVNMAEDNLAQWWNIFCQDQPTPAPTSHIFKPC